MADNWTQLLDDIKVRGMIPTDQQTYTAARLLRLADAVLKSKIIPVVMKVREGYYSWDVDFAITGVLTGYPIPPRFVGGKLEDIAFVNGNQRSGASVYYEHDVTDYTINPSQKPGVYIKRNRIFPLPPDGGGWSTLRMSGILRPNKIVDPTTDAAMVTGIAGNVLTCSGSTGFPIPTTWTTANTFDILQADDFFDWWAIDQTITNITTTTITFTSAIPSTVSVGDWVALARTSPTIMTPEEFHPYFAQEVANIVLKAQGDKQIYEAGLEESKLLHDGLVDVISPRVEKIGKKITNLTGIMRRRM